MFQEIKDAVSVKEAASFYGLKVRRNGMCCCPFHNDKTPSMKVDRRYHCFGCGEDGDVINFVQKLFGLDAKEAAFKLIDDFQLNIDTNRKESRSEKNARIRRMKAKQHEKDICLAYAEELRRFRLKLAELHRTIHSWKIDMAPTKEEWEHDIIDTRFLMAIHNIDRLEYIMDILDFGESEEIYEEYKHREETITLYERRITEAERGAAEGSRGGVAPKRNDKRELGSER